MSTTIQTWYNFVLQQMATESYLDGWNNLALDKRKERLMYGSNNPTYQSLPFDAPILDGATRMTATQAADFLNRYTVIDHLPDTASGFSATLMRDNVTGEYTFSMRSTEYFDPTKGGDWYRDGLTGADGEINSHGFALRQILELKGPGSKYFSRTSQPSPILNCVPRLPYHTPSIYRLSYNSNSPEIKGARLEIFFAH